MPFVPFCAYSSALSCDNICSKSVLCLSQGVTFADEDERYYYDNSVTREAITDLYQPEHMQLMLYETEDISNEHNENPLISKLDLTESISDDKLTGGLKMEREKVGTSKKKDKHRPH